MGHWQGWIEYLPRTGVPPLQTGRETTQSSYDQLVYWATGLTTTYLEMALDRAHPTTSPEPPPPPALVMPGYDPARIRDEHPDSSVVHLVKRSTLPSPSRLMLTQTLVAGRVRHIPGGGNLVYDGVSGPEGEPSRHAFLLQYGSDNAAAVVANHLWSALHGEGATLRIEGEVVGMENHLIHDALRRRLPAHR